MKNFSLVCAFTLVCSLSSHSYANQINNGSSTSVDVVVSKSYNNTDGTSLALLEQYAPLLSDSYNTSLPLTGSNSPYKVLFTGLFGGNLDYTDSSGNQRSINLPGINAMSARLGATQEDMANLINFTAAHPESGTALLFATLNPTVVDFYTAKSDGANYLANLTSIVEDLTKINVPVNGHTQEVGINNTQTEQALNNVLLAMINESYSIPGSNANTVTSTDYANAVDSIMQKYDTAYKSTTEATNAFSDTFNNYFDADSTVAYNGIHLS